MNKFMRFFPLNKGNSQSSKNLEINRNEIHKLYRTNILFGFTLLTFAITFYLCCTIITNPQSNPDLLKFAFSIITAIISGLVVFLTGKAVG